MKDRSPFEFSKTRISHTLIKNFNVHYTTPNPNKKKISKGLTLKAISVALITRYQIPLACVNVVKPRKAETTQPTGCRAPI